MARNPRALSPSEARESAAEFFGFAASEYIKVGGEQFEIPNPGLMDDDQLERYEELQDSLRTFDHDEIERRNAITGEVIVHPVTGQPVVDTVLIEPHRRGGELVRPPYAVRLAIALWGQDGYDRYREKCAATGEKPNSGIIPVIWRKMQRQFSERLAADSKSADRADVDEVVPDGD
jgi:hypothetical protein